MAHFILLSRNKPGYNWEDIFKSKTYHWLNTFLNLGYTCSVIFFFPLLNSLKYTCVFYSNYKQQHAEFHLFYWKEFLLFVKAVLKYCLLSHLRCIMFTISIIIVRMASTLYTIMLKKKEWENFESFWHLIIVGNFKLFELMSLSLQFLSYDKHLLCISETFHEREFFKGF